MTASTMKRCSTPSGCGTRAPRSLCTRRKPRFMGTTSAGTPPSPRRACGGGWRPWRRCWERDVPLHGAFDVLPLSMPAFPSGCKGQHPEPVQRGFHTTGPEPIHVPGSQTTLPGCGRWSRPPTECVSTPSPREPSATLHNGRKMPMEGFEVFQVRDKEECKRSVLEAIKAGYPVFEHRDLANICETTVHAC